MTTMTIDRAVVEEALEALEKHQEALKAWPEHTLAPHECVAMDASEKAITALRAALAQQAELVVGWMDPASGDVISAAQRVVWNEDFGHAGQRKAALFSVPLRATLTQQDEPVLVQGELPPRYVARSPIQAEPVEPVAGVVLNEEGRAALVEHGREEWHCVSRNARRLYTAPPQRKPLTEEVATLTAQRDALLEVLKYLDKEFRQHGRRHWPEAVAARAAIKAVEETK